MRKEDKIQHYISTQILGVISTVNKDGKPEAALVAITETEKLELIFGTPNTTRKYKNIMYNPRVAVVVGFDLKERKTIQFEGVASELQDKELEKYRILHVKKNPTSEKYAFRPDQRFFKVKPTWIRYSDLGSNPQEEFELTFHT